MDKILEVLKEYLSHPSVDGSNKKNELRNKLKELISEIKD